MSQLGLFGDIDEPEQRPVEGIEPTSKAAARRIAPVAGTLRAKVLACIKRAGLLGLTDIECQALLNMDGSTQRPRRQELEKAGLIYRRAEPRRGPRESIVWLVRVGK